MYLVPGITAIRSRVVLCYPLCSFVNYLYLPGLLLRSKKKLNQATNQPITKEIIRPMAIAFVGMRSTTMYALLLNFLLFSSSPLTTYSYGLVPSRISTSKIISLVRAKRRVTDLPSSLSSSLSSSPASTSKLFASTKPSSPSASASSNNGEDKGLDEITAEAEDALREAEEALQLSNQMDVDVNVNGDNLAPNDAIQQLKQKAAIEAQRQQEAQEKAQQNSANRSNQVVALVAGFGAFLFGSISGAFLDVVLIANNLDLDVDPIFPPFFLSFTLGIAVTVLSGQGSDLSSTLKSIFASPILNLVSAIRSAVTNKIDSTVAEIKSTPGKVQSAITEAVQEKADEIVAIPRKVKENIDEKVEKTVEEIKATPGKVIDAAERKIEQTVEEISDATVKTVEEIKATPGKVVKGTKEVIVKTVEDVEEKVEKAVTGAVQDIKKNVDEVSSIPAKTIDQVRM